MDQPNRLASIAIIIFSIMLSSTAHVTLKRGMMSKSAEAAEGLLGQVFQTLLNPWVFAGMLMHIAALGVWLIALKRVDITFAYPFLALGYVLVALMAYFWLGETLTAGKLAGMGLVVAGILVLSLS